MKYFRKHPDILFIANYPEGNHRVRHGRLTTPPLLAKILVRTIAGSLKTKKILLLTDAPEKTQRAGFIQRTALVTGKPHTCFHLISQLIYNHETRTVCILFHPELFGPLWTGFFTLFLVGFLRLMGKQITIIFLTTPKLSPQPTLGHTIQYFLRYALLAILNTLSQQTVGGDKKIARILIPLTFRSLKERRLAGKIVTEELFPSPTHNLGLAHYLSY